MRPIRVFFPLLLIGAIALNAQNQADKDLLLRARSLYHSSFSLPAYIACDSSVNWDVVTKEPGVPQGEGTQQGLELLKAMKIAFVTRGESHTEVTATGDAAIDLPKKKIQQQITEFFHLYWTMSDGRLLPRADSIYEVASIPEGYSVTQHLNSGLITTVQMDSSFLITKAHATGINSDLEITPRFAMENDGLLHLCGMSIDYRVGESKMLVEYSFDYQQAGGFYVPQHVTMSMPGALSFTHTFSNCQVLDKNSAPMPSMPEPPEPR